MDELMFFDGHLDLFPIYECLRESILQRHPDTKIKIGKSQISFYNKHLYACVSFLRVKKKKEHPDDYFVLTLGLGFSLDSLRVAAKVEPYPGRFTTHFVIDKPNDLDDELFSLVDDAYNFAEAK